ncbi:hypothetical protein KILIM_032_00470 [Kineosphaera limosa NBRC 100340]|uniref:Uncharacterized protein n=1 Tax=Kineosphaera limosa NBRC 100340 TaxID=1184609 RepID=K6WQP7_9MICO|nr:hypothetical protein KILIM_032_00470 [Kineosphaera limosa NBRC 100340]
MTRSPTMAGFTEARTATRAVEIGAVETGAVETGAAAATSVREFGSGAATAAVPVAPRATSNALATSSAPLRPCMTSPIHGVAHAWTVLVDWVARPTSKGSTHLGAT